MVQNQYYDISVSGSALLFVVLLTIKILMNKTIQCYYIKLGDN